MRWMYPKNGELPTNDGVECITKYKGRYLILIWCDRYKCWDDTYTDDTFCEGNDVECWQYLHSIDTLLQTNEKLLGETK